MIQDDTGNRIPSKQKKAIVALLECSTISEAAQAANVGRVTLSRWINDDEKFRLELSKAESSLISTATRRLCSLTDKAVKTLESVLESKTASDSTKVRAALGILDSMIKLKTFYELEERITKLELVAEKQSGRNNRR